MAKFPGDPARAQRKRVAWGEEAQWSERAFAAGGSKRYAACADDAGRIEGELKQKLLELRG